MPSYSCCPWTGPYILWDLSDLLQYLPATDFWCILRLPFYCVLLCFGYPRCRRRYRSSILTHIWITAVHISDQLQFGFCMLIEMAVGVSADKPEILPSHPSGPSGNRCMTDSCCTSNRFGWRCISPHISLVIADMPCPVLYSCSWRICPSLVELLSATSTLTDEALSFILLFICPICITPTLKIQFMRAREVFPRPSFSFCQQGLLFYLTCHCAAFLLILQVGIYSCNL